MQKIHALILAAFVFATSVARAENADSGKEVKQVATAQSETWCDKVFSLGKLYRDDDNPILEEFDLTGRLQLDFYHVDAKAGKPGQNGEVDFFEIRRLRLGEDAWLFERHLELKADVDTNLQTRHSTRMFYNRMTNLFANFVICDLFNVRVGKQEPHFGYDREVSDTLQPFFERSFFDDQVFNNTGNDYVSGATIYGKKGNFGYLASVFSLNVDKEFGKFNGGEAYLAEINYDFKSTLGADKALWAFDFLHTDGLNANSNVFNTMHNALATYLDYKKSRFGLVTQFGWADGIAGKGDIYQIMAMPTFDITDKLQVEFRYALGLGTENNSITILNRQEKQVAKATGKTLQSPYLGFNYFICGYNLHFMAGVQYDALSGGKGKSADFDGWTPMVGLRAFF